MVGSWRWQNTKKTCLIGQLGHNLYECERDLKMSDLCDKTAVELRRLIGRKDISPVELMESCITRIEATDGAVNAVVTRAFDRARNEALNAEKAVLNGEELGLLHGLPVGIKDLEATDGIRTTLGSQLYSDHIPNKDQGSVANIRAEGGIIIGKTNTPECSLPAHRPATSRQRQSHPRLWASPSSP